MIEPEGMHIRLNGTYPEHIKIWLHGELVTHAKEIVLVQDIVGDEERDAIARRLLDSVFSDEGTN